MKRILIFLLVLITYQVSAQPPTSPVQVNQNTWYKDINGKFWINSGTSLGWRQMVDSTQLASAGGIIPGGAITSLPTVGFNPGTNITPTTFIRNVFYQSQPPLATLTGGVTAELMATGGVLTGNVNWSATRQAATATLASIVISGFSQTQTPGFSQPAQGGTVSGVASFTYPRNTSTTFTNTVTTTDSKVATASTTFSFLPNRYWGRSSVSSPTQAVILATAGGNAQLSTSVSGTFVITASGSNYPYYAYPANEAALTSIKDVNGFEVISAFNVTTISLTNASGFTQSYYVYTLNAPTSSNYTITTQ